MSARALTRRAGRGRLLADLDQQAALVPGPRSRLGLFRRRHAVPDAARDGRGIARPGASLLAESQQISKSPSKPIPNSAEAARFRAFAAAGVNRLSLGIQALDPEALRILGRLHDRAEAIAAIELARDSFPRFSFDLIYARPGQSVAAWKA